LPRAQVLKVGQPFQMTIVASDLVL